MQHGGITAAVRHSPAPRHNPLPHHQRYRTTTANCLRDPPPPSTRGPDWGGGRVGNVVQTFEGLGSTRPPLTHHPPTIHPPSTHHRCNFITAKSDGWGVEGVGYGHGVRRVLWVGWLSTHFFSFNFFLNDCDFVVTTKKAMEGNATDGPHKVTQHDPVPSPA